VKIKIYSLFVVLFFTIKLTAQGQFQPNPILETKEPNAFPLADANGATAIYVDENDLNTVKKAVSLLQQDMELVSGKKPNIINSVATPPQYIVIVGSLDNSNLIKQLVANKKIKIDSLKNQWEAYQIQVVDKPMKGVEKALVIVGSDRRGTAFGVFDLSQMMGVSPWYWWADVPVVKRKELYLSGNFSKFDKPMVKYRGIFLNDEAPCLSGWTNEKNGGFNQKLYTKVFELILRLKGNYLWPAMWGNAFHVDDPMNPVLADEYGVVIGTSHHEPLMRAHDEWRRYGKDKGKWDYTKNDSTLREFWRSSVKERHKYENIFSLGMRGDGDEPMSRETATTLLEKIVTDQRQIIQEVTGKPAFEKPQLWALYKEVQDYYDKGMRVPDDVTLLLCDDNWGNIRKLPDLDAPKRKGGFGIYYHFDYVGGPRNYKWVNTNPLPRIWEQMHLAYQYNAREIWIVNVGDLKPMEFPISFFLDYAWNPEALTLDKLNSYSKQWAKRTFGDKFANEIADFLEKYAKYNARIKPELLTPDTYSLDNYNEFETVVKDYNTLAQKAQSVYDKIEPAYKDAYYQLVLYPILASANLNELYYTVALNRKYAKLGDAQANVFADKAELLYKKDAELSDYFNTKLANGKWNHFADQTHIGYTYWQQPRNNTMPKVERLIAEQIKPNTEGSQNSTNALNDVVIPTNFKGFVEANGYISIEAEHFTRAIGDKNSAWKVIPDIGRTGGGITTFPVNTPSVLLTKESPRLEFDVLLNSKGEANIQVMLSPTLEFNGNKGLKYAISMDDETPQIVDIHKDRSQKEWNKMVADNIKILTTKHATTATGKHTLKFWAIDPAVILQKIVIDLGGVKSSYLGPPESKHIK
jgi:hypothetical protein